MTHLEAKFEASERRACRTSNQHRSTQRLQVKANEVEARLLKRIEELVRDNPRSGYRSITSYLRLEGWQVNRKRVHRLWQREGYIVPPPRKKRRAQGNAANACDKRRSTGPNEVWTWDFIFDRLEDGRSLKILAITDEYTRESVALEVGRSFTGETVVEVLKKASLERGVPRHIRSDNGTEFVCRAIKKWFQLTGTEGLYIEGGAPWQNGYSESLNSRFRDECLNMNLFYTMKEAHAIVSAWREKYNERRPHSSLGGLPPKVFAKCCLEANSTARSSVPFASRPEPETKTALVTKEEKHQKLSFTLDH